MSWQGEKGARLWGIVLAGGEGNRIRQFVWEKYRLRSPKQYIAFTGSRSMLQHTLDRVERVNPAERIRIVVDPSHFNEVHCQLSGRPRDSIVFQPINRETAPGIFLPLIDIFQRDPRARVAIFPSDHFILEEDRFMDYVTMGRRVIENFPNQVVLLGVRAEGPETDYGWIEPGKPVSRRLGPEVRSVIRFLEKPDAEAALQFHRREFLWNTSVIIIQAGTLIEMARKHLGPIWARFDRMLAAIGTDREPTVIKSEYSRMERANSSRDVLERSAASVSVIEIKNVHWSDWGNGDRVLTTLKQIRRLPMCLQAASRQATG